MNKFVGVYQKNVFLSIKCTGYQVQYEFVHLEYKKKWILKNTHAMYLLSGQVMDHIIVDYIVADTFFCGSTKTTK